MRCGVRVRCGRDLGEIRARCRRGEIAGELANEIQTRSRRDSPAALPLRRSAGGESTGSANPNSTSGAGSSGGSRTATGARQRSAGEKKKGAGSASHQASPTLPATEAQPCYFLWTTFATTGRRTSIQTLRLGSAPSASAATSSPHSAPQQCDPNDCGGEGGIGDERCTVVRAVEARGRRRACAAPTMSRNSGSSAKRQRVIAVMGLMMSRTTRQVGQCQQLCLLVNSTSHQIGKERACLVVERKEESRALGRPEASY